ncbi:MAG: substrate-binding domain-containing protein [Chloroflexota bacterium]
MVRQPTYRMGARAVELLIRRIEQPDAPVREVLLTCSLVVRGSTGPPLTGRDIPDARADRRRLRASCPPASRVHEERDGGPGCLG